MRTQERKLGTAMGTCSPVHCLTLTRQSAANLEIRVAYVYDFHVDVSALRRVGTAVYPTECCGSMYLRRTCAASTKKQAI